MRARLPYDEAVARLGVLEILAAFDPRIVGTPPLALDMPDSDIDLVCCAHDPAAFADDLWRAFSGQNDFRIRQWVGDGQPVIASFHALGWPFEIFGAPMPVDDQPGWRHFALERRLLALGGTAFHTALRTARQAGAKTEPAFAALLGLAGDPYQALLDLEGSPNESLAALLSHSGFKSL